jgi:hypothetical protein
MHQGFADPRSPGQGVTSPDSSAQSFERPSSQASVASLSRITPRRNAGNANMIYFVDTMSGNAQQRINTALARAIYATGLPLSLLENSYWQSALQELRPSYQIPSTYDLSTPLLEAEYKRVMLASEEKIAQALCLSLMTDGWTNVLGDGVINFVISTPEPVFYKAVEPGEERETAVYISSQIINVISKIGSAKFLTVVTDNASNMKAAWAIVEKEYPHITAVGCASHSLNLLLNDIMKVETLSNLFKKAKKIIVYLKSTHVIHAV